MADWKHNAIQGQESEKEAGRGGAECWSDTRIIFDEIAEVMNRDTARRLSRRTGLSRNKIYRIARGLPFMLDYNTVFALQRMGYKICLRPVKK